MKYVIIGRTSTGKTRLAQMLEQQGLSVLRTNTTRTQRSEYDTLSNFLTPDEAAAIPDDQKVLYTKFNNYEYFALKDDIRTADVCVLDPDGLKELIGLLPDTSIHIVHTICSDKTMQHKQAIERADDPVQEEANFKARKQAEDARFTQFETELDSNTTFGKNCVAIHTFNNNFIEESLVTQAVQLVAAKNVYDNMATIVRQCIQLGVVASSKEDAMDFVYPDHIESIPVECAVDRIMASDEGFNRLLSTWLSHPLSIGTPPDILEEERAALDMMDENFTDEYEQLVYPDDEDADLSNDSFTDDADD